MFTATGALSPWTRKAYANVSLRETLFNGSFTAHLKRKSVEYRNALPLPVAGLGGNVVLSAEWRLGRSLLKPRLMVALGTDAGAAVVRPGALFWRKAFFPSKRSRHLGVEVRRARVYVCGGLEWKKVELVFGGVRVCGARLQQSSPTRVAPETHASPPPYSASFTQNKCTRPPPR